MKKEASKPIVVAVVGPTASGKSAIAVRLAKQFNGEVISADSRQVYRGMDIGTGKVARDKIIKKGYFHRGIRHHLLDVASPKRDFSVVRYQKLAKAAIRDILRRGKLPILCGGTGLYVDSVLYDVALPEVRADKKLRAKLEKRSAAELFAELEKLDPARAKAIDRHNKRRLIRALEIIFATGTPLRYTGVSKWREKTAYDVLKFGIAIEPEALRRRIEKRLTDRLKRGMIEEVVRLHKKEGLSWKRLEQFGLEYRSTSLFLQGKIPTQSDFVGTLSQKIRRYSKRQMTWFKRDPDIRWIKKYADAQRLARKFLKRKN